MQSLRRVVPSTRLPCWRLRLTARSSTCGSPRRTYTAGSEATQAVLHPADLTHSLSTSVVAAAASGVCGAEASAAHDAPPSPVEVHQVIARAVQRGRWTHAIRLLLGALQSRCVPLAETYQLVLLAALRGGGWQASVELTEQVATSPLSTTALYHTAADLLLSQLGQESHDFSEALTRVVVDELVPLMLADATSNVAWKPRHRESVLRVLAETNHPQLVSQLFRRWSTTAVAAPFSFSPSWTGAYACGEREAALLMSAFATTGDWRSAETLRVRLPAAADDLLVDYVRAFTVALKNSNAAQTSAEGRDQLVPWEVAMDVAGRHTGCSTLTAAAAQLQRVAHLATAPTDVSRWWWSAETTVHARLTELRRRLATGHNEVAELLSQCHVTTAGVAELLDAVADSGVLSSHGKGASPYWAEWLDVVLTLSRYCPNALVSAKGCADGLSRLLPEPHIGVPRVGASPSPSPVSSPSAAPHVGGDGGDSVEPLWRRVAARMLAEMTPHDGDDGELRCVLTFTATLHYLLYAQEQAASPSSFSPDSTAFSISTAVRDACALWTQRLHRLQSSREGLSHHPRSPALVECQYAVAVHLRTVSVYAKLPTLEQCIAAVLSDAAATTALVDTTILACMEPLGQLGSAAALCEAMCTAFPVDAPAPSHAAFVLLLCTCQQLRDGAAVAAVRPLLRRVESFLRTTPHAEALMVLSAQLQWCWGGSWEGLRSLAVPVLLSQQRWAILARLLACCPPPLSAQEQRAFAACVAGQRLAELQASVSAGDVAQALQRWDDVQRSDDRGADAASLPAPLHAALVSLFAAHRRTMEAREVLAVEAAATDTPWPSLGLRVCRRVIRHPASVVTLSDVWEAAQVASGSAVVKREATAGLAMYAAAAYSLLERDTEAFSLICDAEAYVVRYDASHHHPPPPQQQQQRCTTFMQEEENSNDGASGDDGAYSFGSAVALHKTDLQLAKGMPLFVQCAMPSILLAALPRAAAAGAAVESGRDAAAVWRVIRFVFPLTSHTGAAIRAWAAVLPQLHAAALKLDNQQSNEIPSGDNGAAAAAATVPLVFSLARRLLHEAVEQRIAVPPVVLELAVTAVAAGAFPPDATMELLNGIRQSLVSQCNDNGARAESSSLSAVRSIASQVAQLLAAQGHHAQALEWVNEFGLWSATDESRVAAETAWQWIQASYAAAQRHFDERASLHRRHTSATSEEKAATRHTAPTEGLSLQSLDALLDCGAWADAFSCFLRVVAAPTARRAAATTDAVEFSVAAMETAELRDAFLSPHVLNRVMKSVAQHAPWRTCMQAWLLLCTRLPLLPWCTSAGALAPALDQLLSAMQQQGAGPHEVGTVLVWIVALLDPSPAVVATLSQRFSSAIATATTWTRADGEACAKLLLRLHRVLGEGRVRAAAAAIAEAEAALTVAPPLCVFGEGSSADAAGAPVASEAWLPPGRPALSSDEVDALVVLAPLLLLATTSRLEVLARRHLGGRFTGYELKALLWLYRDELRQRVNAAQESAGDDAVVQGLSQNVALHVCASQAFAQVPRLDVTDASGAAAAWLAEEIFDGLMPLRVASRLWAACHLPAARLAACRWAPVVEAELRAEVLRFHGRPPARLRTAPQLSRQTIAHYWSCFHRVLAPELHFGPLELCCLAAYAPAVAEIRRRHRDTTAAGYRADMCELAARVHRAHFSPSRVPAEDTLAYLRRPHAPAAIVAVMTTAHKTLKELHVQLFEGTAAGAEEAVAHALPPRLRRHFAACAAAVSSAEWTPSRLQQQQQQASLAIAAWRLTAVAEAERSVPHMPCTTTLVGASERADVQTVTTSPHIAMLLSEAQLRLPSLLLRSWVSWVLVECAVPRRPIPPATSLLLVEWTRAALRALNVVAFADNANDDVACSGDVVSQWRAMAATGLHELHHRRCSELSVVWQLLSEADAWPLMNAGHRVALEKMVWPTLAQVKGLPAKTRGNSGVPPNAAKKNECR